MDHQEWLEQHDRMIAEHDKALAEHDERMAEINEKLRHLAIIAEQNEERAGQMMDTFNRMGRLLQIPEQRIDSLEGRRPA